MPHGKRRGAASCTSPGPLSNIDCRPIDIGYLSIMELRHLRYFVQLAEDLHFANAARHLGISQPPLSQQIRQLEDELDVRLFERTSRRVTLTVAGTLFLDEARRTLAQADRAVEVARRAGRGEAGALAIGFNASAPLVPRVAAAIHRFRSTFPDVALSLAEIAAAGQIPAILDRSLDVGFLRSATPPRLPAELSATLLLRERLIVAVRRDHRFAERDGVALSDLAAEPLVAYASHHSGGFTGEVFTLLREAGIEPRVNQSVQEISTLVGLVTAGVGIAVVSESLRALQSPELRYLPIIDDRAESAVWLVSRGADASLTCRNFLDLFEG